MALERMICIKCGREKSEKEFFKMNTGERCDMCKVCLTMHIDNRKPESFMWILEKFNVPYIEKKWIELSNRIYMKDPAKFGPGSVIGQYLRMMNMSQYKDYTYADSDKLNFEDQKLEQEAAARRETQSDENYEADLLNKLESGEISQAEYNTLTLTNAQDETLIIGGGAATFIPDFTAIDEGKIASELSEDEIQYLILKWGGHYRPSEWIAMEEMYNSYANEFELNVDRIETLKKMCRTSIKMDQALDLGDVSAYKAYSAVMKDLRTTGKFTEAQNKEEKQRYLDSIGELVALCEREGGIIEQFPVDPDEYPQDKIDLTIKDLKSYYYNLVAKELGLGDLIESYIEKLEKYQEEEAAKGLEAGLITSAEEAIEEEITNAEAVDFAMFIEDEIEKEAEMLLQSLGMEG